MARAHFADVLIGTSGTGALSLLDGATVHVYDQGTTTPISQTLYAADSGGTTIANPLTSDANGKVEFWLDTPARVDLAASKTGFSPSTRTVDVEAAPSGGGSGLAHVDVQLTDAQIKDLPNNEVLVLPAPGPGLQHVIHAALYLLDTRGGIYGNVDRSDATNLPRLYLVTDLNAYIIQTITADDNNAFINSGLVQWTDLGGPFVGRPGDPLDRPAQASPRNVTDNKATYIGLANGGMGAGALTGGNAANSLSVRVWYALAPAVPFGV